MDEVREKTVGMSLADDEEEGNEDPGVSVHSISESIMSHRAKSSPLPQKTKAKASPSSGNLPPKGEGSGAMMTFASEGAHISRRASAGVSALSAPLLGRQVSEGSSLRDEPVLHSAQVEDVELFPVPPGQVGPQHFRKLKLLGKGGIGKVYLVHLRGTSRLYAMKVLTKEEMIQKNKVKRVMTEREILATANHPFIVTMYASYQTATRLCFIMEFCEGGEFFRVLQKQPRKRLKESAAKFYSAEVLLALEYLHHMGFIYRDLKPENILMRQNGHLALTDFDLSKQAHAVSPRVIEHQLSALEKVRSAFSAKKNSSKLNLLEIVDSEPQIAGEMTSFVGTVEYIAPEVIQGASQSSAVDWWTFGILIYEMLTGTTPFKAEKPEKTFSNIVSHNVKFPEDVELSADCKTIVKKLLRREADRRLGSEQGASEIKRQKWFNNINFDLIRNEKPPIIPIMRDPYDLSQYRDEKPGEVRASFPFRWARLLLTYPAPVCVQHEEKEAMDDSGPMENNPFHNFSMRRPEEVVNRHY